ncbi:hypothetical protein [Streptomyces sp. NBC_01408]|uniref:hypothetical protein n=1 Tax=Streptomyces sp. NBC_01408 TaxID=2903855 RepID=UPI00224E6D8E|nr:hypothetical protein [Streptomyces sp. NBC_01408]MCX4692633.1 hypothetical protein [Streptomyces sp. NBC_01408]
MRRAAGFKDAWTATRHRHPGFACCQAPDLRNDTSSLTQRIDYVLFRGKITALRADRVGEVPADRTPSGLWALRPRRSHEQAPTPLRPGGTRPPSPCGAVRCGAVRCGAVRCGAVRCGAVRCGAVRCGARPWSPTRS